VAALAAAVTAAACAKSPTDILTIVSADPAVPPILILRFTVTGASGTTATSSIRSTLAGDASDRPGPFPFPIALPVTTDPSLAGTVGMEVDGLDWTTYAVIATGSTTAEVMPGQETQAAVTLAVAPATGADGGSPDGGRD
jgi:hypothetical protein